MKKGNGKREKYIVNKNFVIYLQKNSAIIMIMTKNITKFEITFIATGNVEALHITSLT